MAKQKLTAAELARLSEWGRDTLSWQVGARNARVFLGYFGALGFPKGTLAEVGAKEGITRERARQLVANVRRKLGYVPEGVK